MPASLCKPSWLSKFTTWLGFMLVLLWTQFWEFFRAKSGRSVVNKRLGPGYPPLLDSMLGFFYFGVFARVHDSHARPICSRPERVSTLIERRHTPLTVTLRSQWANPRRTRKALNFGSYNYLGFARPPPSTQEDVLTVLRSHGLSFCSSRINGGMNHLLEDLERRIASYVGKEDAICFGMGYAANSMVLSSFTGKGDLLLCDKLNHASALVGVRSSGATYRTFRHNNVRDLERLIVEGISQGQEPERSDGKWVPWDRIFIVYEGIYSMEGEFCPLPKIVELKRKYGVYLYMDEAHSMGGTGAHGRGACDHFRIDPSEVDILMGTFTKSFGAIGGYVAGSREFVDHLRRTCQGALMGLVLPPACVAQIIGCHKLMVGEDGTTTGRDRVETLRKNSIRLYKGLRNLGLEIIGQKGSPVMCIMLYNLSKLIAFTRLTRKRGLMVCIAGYPAVAFFENRARLCVSAQHTEQDIDNCIRIIDEVADLCLIKFTLPWYKRLANLFL